MASPRTYIEMYREAGRLADERFNANENPVKWVKYRDNYLNAICMAEICEHVINKNQL